MTGPQTDLAVYLPTGRPVARFVIAQVVVAVLLGALWWTGLAAPRLSLRESDGSYNTVSGRTTATVQLRNLSPLAVEVRRASLGDGRLTLDSVTVDGRELAGASGRIPGGETATMVLVYTCLPGAGNGAPSPPSPRGPTMRLHLTVGTPVGLERTRAGSIVHFPACSG
jgi:hypothetical protein